MASIYKRKNKDGKHTGWRAVIRMKGYPVTSKSFDRNQEAEDWSQETEQRIKSGQFNFNGHKQQHTYHKLIERQKADGAFEHQRSFDKQEARSALPGQLTVTWRSSSQLSLTPSKDFDG